ncbi:MAG: hypothetical protein FWG42_02050 [Clostridiales bacterium]|nr:hypothetical protein [Clostridiales bacterium]
MTRCIDPALILAIGLVLGLFAACSQLAPDKGLPDIDVGTWAGTGGNLSDAAYVSGGGPVIFDGYFVDFINGVRPALKIKLDSRIKP